MYESLCTIVKGKLIINNIYTLIKALKALRMQREAIYMQFISLIAAKCSCEILVLTIENIIYFLLYTLSQWF